MQGALLRLYKKVRISKRIRTVNSSNIKDCKSHSVKYALLILINTNYNDKLRLESG